MGKKYTAAKAKIAAKPYNMEEAVSLLQQVRCAKFDESVDMAVRLGVDPKQSDQMVRGSVCLPHGTGRKVRVLVFAKGEKEKEAVAAGADYAGAESLLEKIQNGWMDFEVAIATPDMMGAVGKVGKILGPRGLMPNPKSGTVTFDITRAIEEVRKGRVEYRIEKGAIVHLAVGRISFQSDKLCENVMAAIEAIVKAKPSSAKGKYLKSITLSSTMSPGIAIDPNSVMEKVAA